MNTQVQIKKIKEGFVGQKMIVIPPEIHNKIAKNPLINNLYLTAIGFYPYANHHDRRRNTGCSQYILLYCIEGQGTITVQGTRHILNPNHFFIIPRDIPHHYHSSSTDPWSIYWIHFEGKNSDRLYARHTDGSVPSTHSLPYDEHRIGLFNQIFNIIENSFDQRSLELANINLLQFLSSLIYHKETFLSFYEVDCVNKSIKFMKDNLHLNFTLQDFASEQNLSVSHYSDLFKKKTGFSPIQYFNQMKIHQACQYLYFTDMSIKEICNTLGFKDPYYFSRLFKKLMEIAPAQYRNNHKKRT
ncbi:MAG TPA: AraC family transcriptional regulator [Sphingobacterium sp.]|jgi:AraC family transcriptional regulator of arabinose operon|nr:AraC family transcriptional regulator [Sphingobacterium sp.]